jgi:hypothetical protein
MFLGVWRELSDGGSAIGPVVLSVVTGVAGLGSGVVVSGVVGLAAAIVLFRLVPRRGGSGSLSTPDPDLPIRCPRSSLDSPSSSTHRHQLRRIRENTDGGVGS